MVNDEKLIVKYKKSENWEIWKVDENTIRLMPIIGRTYSLQTWETLPHDIGEDCDFQAVYFSGVHVKRYLNYWGLRMDDRDLIYYFANFDNDFQRLQLYVTEDSNVHGERHTFIVNPEVSSDLTPQEKEEFIWMLKKNDFLPEKVSLEMDRRLSTERGNLARALQGVIDSTKIVR